MAGMRSILLMVVLWCVHTEAALSTGEQRDARAIPCPEEADIYPCNCTVLADYETDLDCSAVTSSDELASVFTAHFPLPEFNKLTISGNTYLTTIRDGDLGNEVTFRHIDIQYGILSSIETNALATSRFTLETLRLDYNELTSFPFEEISMFTQLTYFNIRGNNIEEFPSMSSFTLTELEFSFNPVRMISASAFQFLTKLERIWFYDCDLQELSPNTFSGMPDLWSIDLRFNSLQAVEADTFQLSTSYNYIDFYGSSISSVDVNSFQGVTGDIYLYHNELTTLDEYVWKPLFTGSFMLHPIDNPLGCACDMAWLILSDTYKSHLNGGTKCSNGELVHELDPAIYERCP